MNVETLLADLLKRGVQLESRGGELKFKAPKGALSEELKNALRANKQAIIDRIGEGRRYALASFAQQRLWFLEQFAEGRPIYNMSEGALRLRGPLDGGRLRQVLEVIYRRHEALRTVFDELQGLPVQVVLSDARLDWHEQDAAEFEARERGSAAIRQQFNLAQGPLFRAQLFRIAPDDHLLVLPMHHILFDGWSFGVLLQELSSLYESDAQDDALLPPMPMQYADFAREQRRLLSGEKLAHELAFWRERLGGEIPALELPGDRPRPAQRQFKAAKYVFDITPEETEALHALCRAEGVTLFMALLALFKTFLYRYTYQPDLLIGCPIAGRTLPGSDQLLGFFVNAIGLRTRLDGAQPFRAYLRHVRERALEAYEHQEVPFDRVVEELQPERAASGMTLFNMMFVLENAPLPRVEFGGVRFALEDLDTAAAKFDLTMAMIEWDGGLHTTVEYDEDLFDRGTIMRMMEHFRTLVHGACATPELPVHALPMMSARERDEVVHAFNATQREYPTSPLVPDLIALRAARTPNALAVDDQQTALTYGQLDTAANRLAALIAREARPSEAAGNLEDSEFIVAVFVDRSAYLLLAQLAAWRAGMAYVPIDPAYPRQRVQYLLEDSGARAIVTTEALAGKLPETTLPIIMADTQHEHGETAFGPHPVRAEQLAYVIYTSGSTGTPKGVAVEHRSLLNLVHWHNEAFEVNERSRATLVAGPAFDASVWEIWPYLSAGASVHIPRENDRSMPETLRDWLINREITVSFLPTPLAEAMLGLEWPSQAPLRYLLTGGDRLRLYPPPNLPFTLVNNYGPTENTVVTTSTRVRPEPETLSSPGIGGPIANNHVLVLDPFGNLVPVGVAGELHVGGASLAREYLRRPELTEARFVTRDDDRLYRTGDLVRWRPGGQIEFLGRIDQQVKVRGYRIELGEIESVLKEHPLVADSVVLARNDIAPDTRLVGYVVQRRQDEKPAADADAADEHAAHINQWQSLYDSTYSLADRVDDPTLNLTGWNSSYTGGQIPEAEMRQWVEATVERILAIGPRRVLEIGCGTGMLLFRIAPQVERYEAWDFSRVALRHVESVLAQRTVQAEVVLRNRMADNFEGVEPGSVDTVILNSIIQYFPGAGYLTRVLEQALDALKPGGTLVVGDVRSLPMLETYAASVQLFQADANTSLETLRRRVAQHVQNEEELVIDPEYFHALKRRNPRVLGVEVLPKVSPYANELTRFRYDVLIHVRDDPNKRSTAVELLRPAENESWQWQDWPGQDAVEDQLHGDASPLLAFTRVPNAKLRTESRLLPWLEQGEGTDIVAAFLSGTDMPGIEVDEIHELARRTGCRAAIDWSRQGREGTFDVVFYRGDAPVIADWQPIPPDRPLNDYTNNPLQAVFSRKLAPVLRDFLAERLPDYMIPSYFVGLAEIPLTPNGKIDYRALPAPERARTGDESEFVAPRNEVESALAQLWCSLLSIASVGVHDSFFELGGHSLLATQLLSRVREQFGVQVPLRELFDTPTIAALAERILEKEQAEALPRVLPAPRTGAMPLSYGQLRLWFLEQLEPGTSTYNMPLALWLNGPLDLQALERTLSALVERHESLRTTFSSHGDEPVQVVAPPAPVALDLHDLAAADVSEQALQMRLQQLIEAPFDLAAGPLFRAHLLRRAPDAHVLVFIMHHIIGDGWSLGVLMREFNTLYAAFASGSPSPLLAPSLQYADYAVWQRNWLDSGVAEAQLQYWRGKLGDDPPALELPADFAVTDATRFAGDTMHFALDEALGEPLRAFCAETGASPFMVLLAAFKALLFRWTGQGDLVVGSPIAGRPRPELEELFGFFLNTLALRTSLENAPTFRDLVTRVRDTALEAFAHQDVPFERIVEDLDPQRDLNRTPLFQVLFVLENMPEMQFDLAGLHAEFIELHPATTKFDLNLHLREEQGRLRGFLQYSTGRFRRETMEQFLAWFESLLLNALKHPDAAIAGLTLLKTTQTPVRLDDIVAPARDFEIFGDAVLEAPIHARFAEMAARHADALALWTPQGSWTYRDIDRMSNGIAQALHARRAGEERVGLLLRRSGSMLAAMLGTLQAGKSYVAIDPDYPAERVAYMLQDAEAEVLLVDETTAASVAHLADRGTAILRAGDIPAANDALQLDVSPDTLAYILYTSGSTGMPKGVMQSHRNVLHFIRVYTNNLKISPRDRLTLVPTYSFDAAVMDIYGALLNGASLYSIDAREMGIEAISGIVREHALTIYHSTPTVYRAWLQSLDGDGLFPSLRLAVLGGEETTQEDFERFRQHFPCDAYFVNGLGPTESTVTLQRILHHESHVESRTVDVGWPVDHTEILLLAESGEDAQLYGEIAVRSPHVALGYWRNAEQTALAFRDNGDGTRTYRTGDLGRRLANGALVFMGRRDFQVKIRGFRVELGEIEAALRRRHAVREALVVAKDGPSGEKLLAAYIVAEAPGALSAAQLREALVETLPDYMVPAAYVFLEHMPQTPTGKLDRRALPEPEIDSLRAEADYVPPRSATEQQLAEMWAALLGLQRVGIHDNFFNIGGHSLLATRLVARIREAFQAPLALKEFFEHPTIAQLIPRLEGETREEAPPLTPIPRDEVMPVSFAQQRLWFVEQLNPGSSAYVLPAPLRLRGALNVNALRRALETIVQRHEALRTHFALRDGLPVQVITENVSLAWSQEYGGEPRAFATRIAQQPFNLEQGPLIRAGMLELASDDHVLVVSMHHIVSDGWSMGVFARELSALYLVFASGHESPLPALPIQYADYAAWQRSWLQGHLLDRQLAFWKARLADAPVLELPTDFPRPPVQRFEGALEMEYLPEPLAQQLNALGHAHGATLFMTLLASFAGLLHRYTSQDDLVIATPVANRTRPELEQLIGFFVNSLALRIPLQHAPSFGELITRVRKLVWDALEHQDVPFEQVVQAVNPERDMSRSPIAQVAFALQNTPFEGVVLPNLDVELQPLDFNSTRYDLEWHVRETAQGLRCVVAYNTSLFRRETILRMMRHWRMILEQMVKDPAQKVTAHALLTAEERVLVLSQWNQTERPFPGDTPVHALVEKVALSTPGATAIVEGSARVTYGELDERANRLANHLRQRGVRSGDAVAVLLERSTGMTIALLGILKAGAVYVPIDLSYPPDRIGYMIRDAGAPVTITLEEHLPLLADLAARESGGRDADGQDGGAGGLICLDRDAPAIAAERAQAPSIEVGGEDPAYIIYTSGSTGQPKGVVVPHRAIVRLVRNTNYVDFSADIVMAHVSNTSFDAATFELWGALCNGASLVILARDTVLSPEALAGAIQRHGITTMFLTTSLFNQVAHLRPDAFAPMREILFGGESADADAVRRVAAACPGVRLVNGYGPTEVTTFATWFEAGEVPPDWSTLPIGRPIANTRCYVLDGDLHPVPVGVPGELFLGGEGLALGYHNRPELTREKFLLWNEPEQQRRIRLYRSGDLVKYREDGNLEMLGRLDGQVKIRGFRIELGEIESLLQRHAHVAKAVVLPREWRSGDTRLVAYTVAKDGAVDELLLRDYCKQHLPPYMVPDYFVAVERIPVNANGKIDKRALPMPETQGRAEGGAPPQGATEERVAEIWEGVLHRSPASREEVFFDAGGNSLLLVQFVSRLNEAFALELSLQEAFREPTVAKIGQLVEHTRGGTALAEGEAADLVVALRTFGSRPALFCIAPAGGTVYPYYALMHALGPDQPVYALQDPAFMRDQEACGTIEEMARLYIESLRRVQPRGPYHLLGWSFGAVVVFEMAQQLRAAGEEVALAGMIEYIVEEPGARQSLRDRTRDWVFNRLHSLQHLGSVLKNMLDGLSVSVAFLQRTGQTKYRPGSLGDRLSRWTVGLAWKILLSRNTDMAGVVNEEAQLALIKHPVANLFVKIAAANLNALKRYEMKPYAGRITVFRAEDQPRRGRQLDPTNGWSQYVRDIGLHVVPGDHFSIMRNPDVEALAKAVRAEMEPERTEGTDARSGALV